MVEEAISIQPQDVRGLDEVSRVLESGAATLSGPNGEHVALPAPLCELLKHAVRLMGDGKSTVVLSEEQELTTERAAELLGIPHRYIIRLIDGGDVPYHLVGKYQRVSLRDVVVFAKRRAAMKAALAQMSRDAFEAGLYDNHAGLLEGQSDE